MLGVLISTGKLLAFVQWDFSRKKYTILLHWPVSILVWFVPWAKLGDAANARPFLSNNKSAKINISAQSVCECVRERATFSVPAVSETCKLCLANNETKLYLISIIITLSFRFFHFLLASFRYNAEKERGERERIKRNKRRKRNKLKFFYRSASAKAIASISADVNEFICFVRNRNSVFAARKLTFSNGSHGASKTSEIKRKRIELENGEKKKEIN